MNYKKNINFTNLDPKAILVIFLKHQVTFPRDLRIKVLLDLIEPKYIEEKLKLEKQEKESVNSMTIKDYIRLNRLNQYSTLSEFQLENDYDYYNDLNLNQVYFNTLWDEYIKYLEDHPHMEKVMKDIELLEVDENRQPLSVYKYNLEFSSIITDDDNCFDGIHLEESVRHFDTSSVANEIKKLGEKYDIIIPKYWTKLDMQDKLRKELKSRKMYNDEYESKIQEASKKVICSMLDDINADSKLHITKADMINIIIKNVDINKVSEISVKEMTEEIEEVEQSPKVIEVEKTVEAISVPDNKQVDYTNLLQEIIHNQEIIISQTNDKKSTTLDKVFNFIVIILVILVVILWVFYAIETF